LARADPQALSEVVHGLIFEPAFVYQTQRPRDCGGASRPGWRARRGLGTAPEARS
jgi:hypothetical protein